jgi:hypothetical protein
MYRTLLYTSRFEANRVYVALRRKHVLPRPPGTPRYWHRLTGGYPSGSPLVRQSLTQGVISRDGLGFDDLAHYTFVNRQNGAGGPGYCLTSSS